MELEKHLVLNGLKAKKENIYKIWNYLFNRKVVKENWILRKNLEYKLENFIKRKEENGSCGYLVLLC